MSIFQVHLRQVSSEEGNIETETFITYSNFLPPNTGDILAKDFDCNFREVAAADQVNEVFTASHITQTPSLFQDCGRISWVMSGRPRGQEEEQDVAAGPCAGGEGGQDSQESLTSLVILSL